MNTSMVPRQTPVLTGDVMSESWWRFVQDLYQWSGLAGEKFPLYAAHGMVPAKNMVADGVAPPGQTTLTAPLYGAAFDKDASERMHFDFIVPYGYQAASALTPCVKWMPTTADAGTVRWIIDWSWVADGVALPTLGSETIDAAASEVAMTSQTDTGAAVDVVALDVGVNLEPGMMMLCSIYRHGAATEDDYPADAILLAGGFVLQNSAHGSQTVVP